MNGQRTAGRGQSRSHSRSEGCRRASALLALALAPEWALRFVGKQRRQRSSCCPLKMTEYQDLGGARPQQLEEPRDHAGGGKSPRQRRGNGVLRLAFGDALAVLARPPWRSRGDHNKDGAGSPQCTAALVRRIRVCTGALRCPGARTLRLSLLR